MLTSPHFFIGDDDGTIENLGDSGKNRSNDCLDNMIGNNNVVSEWKETSHCLKLTLAFLARILAIII